MNTSFTEDPKIKLLSSFKTSVDKWQSDIKAGKEILSKIVEQKKKALLLASEEDSDTKITNHCPELQDLCNRFNRVCENLRDRKANFARVAEKIATLAALEDARNSMIEVGDSGEICTLAALSSHVNHLCQRHQEQYEYCVGVVEEITLCKSEDELMFLQAVWLQQPALDGRCDLAEKVINCQIE